MEPRKLVKAGAVSHTISLPKAWLEKNKLKKGDVVYINEGQNNELIITKEPDSKKPYLKSIVINAGNKKIDTIQREITSAYVNNSSTISIIDEELYKRIKEIRRIVHNFVALEITEQTSTKIEVKDLLNIEEVSQEKTIRRMDNIIRSMLKDINTAVNSVDMQNSIFYRDYDLNKLYFLMFKLIKRAVKEESAIKSLGFKDMEQVLSIWYLIINMENVADSIKGICQLFNEIKERDAIKMLEGAFSILENSYLEVMNSYYKNDKAAADKTASDREAVLKKIADASRGSKEASSIKIVESLKEMENYICNIARTVIDY